MYKLILKLPDWLQHSVWAAIIMAGSWVIWAVFLGAYGHFAGAAIGIAVYFGREHRDVETADNSMYDNPKALMFWTWPKDQLTDFVAPLISNSLLAALVQLVF